MAFKGTDVQYIGPVYVDWTKKFKEGFDLTAVKSYLTEKNQQWIFNLIIGSCEYKKNKK